MRFTESKKKMPWVLIIVIMAVSIVFALSFCGMNPNQKIVQKTIVFEAD